MTLPRLLAIFVLAAAVSGCIRTQPGSDGVFEPTRVQPPPSERGSGLDQGTAPVAEEAAAAAKGRRARGALSVPSR